MKKEKNWKGMEDQNGKEEKKRVIGKNETKRQGIKGEMERIKRKRGKYC